MTSFFCCRLTADERKGAALPLKLFHLAGLCSPAPANNKLGVQGIPSPAEGQGASSPL